MSQEPREFNCKVCGANLGRHALRLVVEIHFARIVARCPLCQGMTPIGIDVNGFVHPRE